MRSLFIFLSLLAVVATVPEAARADAWRWPVDGRVATRFAYREATPFTRGQHRGVDIAVAVGTAVRSACSGRVHFAGSVAGSEGIVSVVCGRLTASYLHLGSIEVRAGSGIVASERIGTVGRRSRLYLGARRTGERFGYVDPLTLLRSRQPHGAPVLPRFRLRRVPVAAPLGPAPRPVPAWRSVPIAHAAKPSYRPAAHPQPARPPLVVWVGLGLLAAALPSWGIRRARRRRREPIAAASARLANALSE